MSSDSLLLFSMDQHGTLVEALVERLGTFLSPHELRIFEDGECKIRPLCDVESKDVYILATLYADGQSSVHDQLCRALFFVGALRDAGAGRITILSPYLCYSRKDRKTKSRDPTTIQYVARLMESMGVDRLVTVDVHNLAAFQNAFRISHAHLEASDLLLGGVAQKMLDHRGENHRPLMVLSPDLGAIKKAQKARDTLGRDYLIHASFGVLYKERSGSELNTGDLIGEVKGRDVLIVDDMIATGSTMERAAEICLGQGANRVMLMATHALLTGDAKRLLSRDVFHSVVVTNTIFHKNLPPELESKIVVVDIAPLLAHIMTEWHGKRRFLAN
jgi:ribose-phosphate pyrophosphokinase